MAHGNLSFVGTIFIGCLLMVVTSKMNIENQSPLHMRTKTHGHRFAAGGEDKNTKSCHSCASFVDKVRKLIPVDLSDPEEVIATNKVCADAKMCDLWSMHSARIARLLNADLCPADVCTDLGYCSHHECQACKESVKAAALDPAKPLSKCSKDGDTPASSEAVVASTSKKDAEYCAKLSGFPELLAGAAPDAQVTGACVALGDCTDAGEDTPDTSGVTCGGAAHKLKLPTVEEMTQGVEYVYSYEQRVKGESEHDMKKAGGAGAEDVKKGDFHSLIKAKVTIVPVGVVAADATKKKGSPLAIERMLFEMKLSDVTRGIPANAATAQFGKRKSKWMLKWPNGRYKLPIYFNRLTGVGYSIMPKDFPKALIGKAIPKVHVPVGWQKDFDSQMYRSYEGGKVHAPKYLYDLSVPAPNYDYAEDTLEDGQEGSYVETAMEGFQSPFYFTQTQDGRIANVFHKAGDDKGKVTFKQGIASLFHFTKGSGLMEKDVFKLADQDSGGSFMADYKVMRLQRPGGEKVLTMLISRGEKRLVEGKLTDKKSDQMVIGDSDGNLAVQDEGHTAVKFSLVLGVPETVVADRDFANKEHEIEETPDPNEVYPVNHIACDDDYCKKKEEDKPEESTKDKAAFKGHSTMKLLSVKVCKVKGCQEAKFKASREHYRATAAKAAAGGASAHAKTHRHSRGHSGWAFDNAALLEVAEQQVPAGSVHAHEHTHFHFPTVDHVVAFLNAMHVNATPDLPHSMDVAGAVAAHMGVSEASPSLRRSPASSAAKGKAKASAYQPMHDFHYRPLSHVFPADTSRDFPLEHLAGRPRLAQAVISRARSLWMSTDEARSHANFQELSRLLTLRHVADAALEWLQDDAADGLLLSAQDRLRLLMALGSNAHLWAHTAAGLTRLLTDTYEEGSQPWTHTQWALMEAAPYRPLLEYCTAVSQDSSRSPYVRKSVGLLLGALAGRLPHHGSEQEKAATAAAPLWPTPESLRAAVDAAADVDAASTAAAAVDALMHQTFVHAGPEYDADADAAAAAAAAAAEYPPVFEVPLLHPVDLPVPSWMYDPAYHTPQLHASLLSHLTDVLQSASDRGDIPAVHLALSALGNTRSRHAVADRIHPFLLHPRPCVRRQALMALDYNPHPMAIKLLAAAAAGDPHPRVQQKAADMLMRRTGLSPQQLQPLLDTHRASAEAMGAQYRVSGGDNVAVDADSSTTFVNPNHTSLFADADADALRYSNHSSHTRGGLGSGSGSGSAVDTVSLLQLQQREVQAQGSGSGSGSGSGKEALLKPPDLAQTVDKYWEKVWGTKDINFKVLTNLTASFTLLSAEAQKEATRGVKAFGSGGAQGKLKVFDFSVTVLGVDTEISLDTAGDNHFKASITLMGFTYSPESVRKARLDSLDVLSTLCGEVKAIQLVNGIEFSGPKMCFGSGCPLNPNYVNGLMVCADFSGVQVCISVLATVKMGFAFGIGKCESSHLDNGVGVYKVPNVGLGVTVTASGKIAGGLVGIDVAVELTIVNIAIPIVAGSGVSKDKAHLNDCEGADINIFVMQGDVKLIITVAWVFRLELWKLKFPGEDNKYGGWVWRAKIPLGDPKCIETANPAAVSDPEKAGGYFVVMPTKGGWNSGQDFQWMLFGDGAWVTHSPISAAPSGKVLKINTAAKLEDVHAKKCVQSSAPKKLSFDACDAVKAFTYFEHRKQVATDEDVVGKQLFYPALPGGTPAADSKPLFEGLVSMASRPFHLKLLSDSLYLAVPKDSLLPNAPLFMSHFRSDGSQADSKLSMVRLMSGHLVMSAPTVTGTENSVGCLAIEGLETPELAAPGLQALEFRESGMCWRGILQSGKPGQAELDAQLSPCALNEMTSTMWMSYDAEAGKLKFALRAGGEPLCLGAQPNADAEQKTILPVAVGCGDKGADGKPLLNKWEMKAGTLRNRATGQLLMVHSPKNLPPRMLFRYNWRKWGFIEGDLALALTNSHPASKHYVSLTDVSLVQDVESTRWWNEFLPLRDHPEAAKLAMAACKALAAQVTNTKLDFQNDPVEFCTGDEPAVIFPSEEWFTGNCECDGDMFSADLGRKVWHCLNLQKKCVIPGGEGQIKSFMKPYSMQQSEQLGWKNHGASYYKKRDVYVKYPNPKLSEAQQAIKERLGELNVWKFRFYQRNFGVETFSGYQDIVHPTDEGEGEMKVVKYQPRLVVSHCVLDYPGQMWTFSTKNGLSNTMTNTHLMIGGVDEQLYKPEEGRTPVFLEPQKGAASMKPKDSVNEAIITVRPEYAKK